MTKRRYDRDKTPLRPQKYVIQDIRHRIRIFFSIEIDENHIISTYLTINYISYLLI